MPFAWLRRMFFESWQSLGRTALAGAIAYVALIVFLRISGKRTLSKLNAFDLVVTVALGSTLSAIMTSSTLPVANGLLALGMLVTLQFVIAWLAARFAWFSNLVTSRPAAVFQAGTFAGQAMKRERLTRDEILMAMRSAGSRDLGRVSRVVLEPDGSLSVLHDLGERPPIDDVAVARAPERAGSRGRVS